MEIFLISGDPPRNFVDPLMADNVPESIEDLIDKESFVKLLVMARMRRYPSIMERAGQR